MRVFSILREEGDARRMIAGVLALLLVAAVTLRAADPELQLRKLLARLSPAVGVVILEPAVARDGEPSPWGTDLRALLNVIVPELAETLPSGRFPRATLLVDGPDGADRVALFDAATAARAGLVGKRVDGFVAVGGAAARAFLDRPSGEALDPTLLHTLRERSGVRVLLRPSWLKQQHHVLARLPASDRFVGLRLSGDLHHLRIDGVIPKAADGLAEARTLLRTTPSSSLLVLDGVPLRVLLPKELPPLLAALRAESGVADELEALVSLIGPAPSVVVLRWSAASVPEIAVGFPIPRTTDTGALTEKIRAFVDRRLVLVSAVTERLRVDGRTILHRKPGEPDRMDLPGVAGGVGSSRTAVEAPARTEEVLGPWRVLRAPRAAGTADLFAVVGADGAVVGTSQGLTLAIAEQLAEKTAVLGAPAVTFVVDGDLLRRLPSVTLALRGLEVRPRSWLTALQAARIRFWREDTAVRFDAVADFRPTLP